MLDDEETRITLRLPRELRDRVKNSAEAQNRSINNEIVSRIEASFGPPHSILISALMEMGGALLDETLSLTLPPDVIDKLHSIGELRGLSVEATISVFITRAVYHISARTELGKLIETVIDDKRKG